MAISGFAEIQDSAGREPDNGTAELRPSGRNPVYGRLWDKPVFTKWNLIRYNAKASISKQSETVISS
jgi:hypothetical protein